MKESQKDRSCGTFTVSLDFELFWGICDKRPYSEYRENLLGANEVIPDILNLFAEKGVHATWATVGFLFDSCFSDLKRRLPQKRPSYEQGELSPFDFIENHEELENSEGFDEQCFFAPGLIRLINSTSGQELGTHTYSHYYCLEPGQTKSEFEADLSAAKEVANSFGIEIRSIVFPRNQCNLDYMSCLEEVGISSYRGNESTWSRQFGAVSSDNVLRRALRFFDSYLNLTGHHTYPIHEYVDCRPFNFPASRYLRPYSRRTAGFERLRLKRITEAMTFAAANHHVYHLWWHPHNFGANKEENLEFLRKICEHYNQLSSRHDMRSLNMGELSDALEAFKTR